MNVRLEGGITVKKATHPFELQSFGDEQAYVAVRGWPRTLLLYLHSWSGVKEECLDHTDLDNLKDCVIVGMSFGGPNDHPQGAGHPAQLERIDRCRMALRAQFPMIERVLVFGQSGGGYTGLMYMSAYPGAVYGASLWVFPYDLADWWQQKSQYRPSLENCMGGTPAQVPAEYLARSPMSRTITNTRLFLNGSPQDLTVPYTHQIAAKNRFSTMSGNVVVFNNGEPEENNAQGHETKWPVARAQLESMYPS